MARVQVTFSAQGGGLNEEQYVFALTRGILERYRPVLEKHPQDQREVLARRLAVELARRTNECGRRQFRDVAPAVLGLGVPSAEECQRLEASIREMVEIRIVEPKSAVDRVSGWIGRNVRQASGVIWAALYKRLSGHDAPIDDVGSGNGGGVRG
jgi:hypothetical protein